MFRDLKKRTEKLISQLKAVQEPVLALEKFEVLQQPKFTSYQRMIRDRDQKTADLKKKTEKLKSQLKPVHVPTLALKRFEELETKGKHVHAREQNHYICLSKLINFIAQILLILVILP